MRPCACARARPVHVCARPVASKIHASCVGYVHLAVDVHNSFCLEYLRRRGGGPSPSPPVPRRRVTQVSHLTSNKSSPGTSEISLNRLTENGVAPDATGVGRITRSSAYRGSRRSFFVSRRPSTPMVLPFVGSPEQRERDHLGDAILEDD